MGLESCTTQYIDPCYSKSETSIVQGLQCVGPNQKSGQGQPAIKLINK